MEHNTYKNLGAFRFWCQKVLPLAYDDSLSYYELLCKLVNYLNDTVKNVELMGEDIAKLYNYVNGYFDNLDVQNEINAKLDKMATDGSLGVLVEHLFDEYKEQFDNAIAYQNTDINMLNRRMDTFTSLGAGSTTGDSELIDIRVGADGTVYESAGTSVRKQMVLRNVTSELVAQVPTLDVLPIEEAIELIENKGAEVLESLPSDYTKTCQDVKSLEQQVSILTEDFNEIGLAKKYIFIGDSYISLSENSYAHIIKNKLGLNATIIGSGGSGFVDEGEKGTFLTLLQTLSDDNGVTDIVVMGGLNDSGHANIDNIPTALQNFCNYAKTHFPNAKIHVGFLGRTKSSGEHAYTYLKVMQYYKQNCGCGYNYIKNSENVITRVSYISSDGIHPTSEGHEKIANNLLPYFRGGTIDVLDSNLLLTLTPSNNCNGSNIKWDIIRDNGDIRIAQRGYSFMQSNGVTQEFNGTLSSKILMGSISQDMLWGKKDANTNEYLVGVETPVVLTVSNKRYNGFCRFLFEGSNLYIIPVVYDGTQQTGYHMSGTLTEMVICPFDKVLPAFRV